MVKKTVVEQRILKSETGKPRKGMYKFNFEKNEPLDINETDPEKLKAFMDQFSDLPSTETRLTEYIDGLEEFAREIILDKGINPDDRDKRYTRDDGTFTNSEGMLKELKSQREPEGYANEILFHSRVLKNMLKKGDLLNSVFHAIKMEEAYRYFVLSQYELAILIGDDILHKGKTAKYSEKQKKDWLNRATQLILSKQNRYVMASGKPNFTQIAKKIQSDSSLPERATETVRKYLASAIKEW